MWMILQIRDLRKQILILKRVNATIIKPFSALYDFPAAILQM
jgi:hypothetical protein